MSRAVALLCACALAVNVVVPAPAPPRRTDNKDLGKNMEERSIVIRRVQKAYAYPFSLWPLPKYPALQASPEYEYIYNGKTFKKVRVQRKKR